jgi:hypothetical protein
LALVLGGWGQCRGFHELPSSLRVPPASASAQSATHAAKNCASRTLCASRVAMLSQACHPAIQLFTTIVIAKATCLSTLGQLAIRYVVSQRPSQRAPQGEGEQARRGQGHYAALRARAHAASRPALPALPSAHAWRRRGRGWGLRRRAWRRGWRWRRAWRHRRRRGGRGAGRQRRRGRRRGRRGPPGHLDGCAHARNVVKLGARRHEEHERHVQNLACGKRG